MLATCATECATGGVGAITVECAPDPGQPNERAEVRAACVEACAACTDIPAAAPFSSRCSAECESDAIVADDVQCPVVLEAPCWNGYDPNESCWERVVLQDGEDGFDAWWTLLPPLTTDADIVEVALCERLVVEDGSITERVSGCDAQQTDAYQLADDDSSVLVSLRVGRYDESLSGTWYEWVEVYASR